MQNKINETIKTNTKKVWIGDLAYILRDDLWDSFCKKTYRHGVEKYHVIEMNCKGLDLTFIQCSTGNGEDIYQSQTGFEYSADSGHIAIVPEELVCEGEYLDDTLGKYFEIKTDVISLETDGKGTFIFRDGEKVIETIWTGDEGITHEKIVHEEIED